MEPNQSGSKAEKSLFSVDPRPFEYEVQRLGRCSPRRPGRRRGASGRTCKAAEAQIAVSTESSDAIKGSIEATRARLKLAETAGRPDEGAGGERAPAMSSRRSAGRSRPEQHRADLGALLPQLAATEKEVAAMARAKAASAQGKGRRDGQVTIRPASRRYGPSCGRHEWKLAETSAYTPADGHVINLQFRPGSTVAELPLDAGHVVRRAGRHVIHCDVLARTSCAWSEPATKRAGARPPIRAGSSRPRSTRSSGHRDRDSCRSPARCRRPAPHRRRKADSR